MGRVGARRGSVAETTFRGTAKPLGAALGDLRPESIPGLRPIRAGLRSVALESGSGEPRRCLIASERGGLAAGTNSGASSSSCGHFKFKFEVLDLSRLLMLLWCRLKGTTGT